MRLCFALLPALVLAACDTGGPAPPGEPPIVPPLPVPTVAVVRPIEDVAVFEDASRYVPLEVVFRQRDGAPLTYAAEVLAGAAVTARISAYGYLALEPAAVGESVVRVTARDSMGATAADTLTVRVLDACPPPPPDGWEDRFPMDSVTTWTFRGAQTRVYATRTDSTVHAGDLQLTAQGCRSGRRQYAMRIRRTAPNPVTYTYTLVDDFARGLSYEPYSPGDVGFPRFAEAAAPDTVLASALLGNLNGALCPDAYGSTRQVWLVAGRGPVRLTGTAPLNSPTLGQGLMTCTIRRLGP